MGIQINGGQMKFIGILIGILTAFFSQDLMAATCTSISRTDNAASSVLTSTKYNTDLNTAYTALNAIDLGCSAASSLDDIATLDASVFGVLINAPITGCRVSVSDAATLSVGKCKIAVGDNLLTTTVATTVTWGCSGCSAEVVSTTYYLKVKDQSTFALLIDTTAPGADGYDATGHRVIARFYNDASGDIVAVGNWVQGWYEPYSIIEVHTSNGFGSDTGNDIRRFTTTLTSIGGAITYADSATAGSTFTINEPGIFSIAYIDSSGNGGVFGISNNTSDVTTNAAGTAAAELLGVAAVAANNAHLGVAWTGALNSGDVIRPHFDAGTTAPSTTNRTRFTIAKIANLEN